MQTLVKQPRLQTREINAWEVMIYDDQMGFVFQSYLSNRLSPTCIKLVRLGPVMTGAAQPEYTITADDYDSMVAIECVPMDERGRRVSCPASFLEEWKNSQNVAHRFFLLTLPNSSSFCMHSLAFCVWGFPGFQGDLVTVMANDGNWITRGQLWHILDLQLSGSAATSCFFRLMIGLHNIKRMI